MSHIFFKLLENSVWATLSLSYDVVNPQYYFKFKSDSVSLSVTNSKPKRCTDLNKICHVNTSILMEGYRLLFSTIRVASRN